MIFTSESVTAGHPDKICDQISDAFVDEALRQDPESHMAVEVTIKDDLIFVYGEAGTKAKIDYEKIAKKVIKEIGYPEEYKVEMHVKNQSAEINNAVRKSDGQIGAGDQGIMFGYACNETDEYMPAAFYYACLLSRKLGALQKSDSRLGPDGKTQVSVEYDDQGKVKRIDTIIVSTMHKKEVSQDEIHELIMNQLIKPNIEAKLMDEKTKIFINPSGSFVVGGSFGDSGTTGRKIVSDSYGGYGRVGGGCFSSKDPSKVDRSAAYYARYVAKNVVANKLADRCEIELAYAIGIAQPISLSIETFGTEKVSKDEILKIIDKNFDFSVKNMIDELDLRRPIYQDTACYGHFGNPDYSWEKIIELKR